MRDILIKTRIRVRELSMDLTEDEHEYALDADVLQMLELYATNSNGDGRPLEPITLDEFNAKRLFSDIGTTPVTEYTLQGSDLLLVYPSPGSGESIKGQYVPKPTAMSATGNDPSTDTYGGIPVEYHDAIELYVLWHGARADDHQASARGQQYFARYYQRIAEMRRELLAKRGNRLPIARVGRRQRSRRYVSNDPSVGFLY